MSFAVAAAWGRSTTAEATSSPSVAWGTAKAMASATAGCCRRTSSTSCGATFSPPRLMISRMRPVEKEVPVVVEEAEIAGPEPVAGKSGLGRHRVAVVACHDACAPNDNLASLAVREQGASFVHDRDVQIRL